MSDPMPRAPALGRTFEPAICGAEPQEAKPAARRPERAGAYRPDIDGLRAIAVLSVISFHLERRYFPSGYLGVDIFFVISGYLITSILWREITEDRFSVARFYDRRIRRIMPALLLVLAATTVVALALLLPADLIGCARALMSTVLFVANVYFWRDTNYFTRAAEDKPLLHMWSLGVEEQFYLLFPLILLLLRRAPLRVVVMAIIGLTTTSLLANAVALYLGADSPAFFLLPTRAWELGSGALLALLPHSQPRRPLTASVTGLLGVALVLLAIVREDMPLGAIPVATGAVMGTVMVIWAGSAASGLARRALAFPPLVFIGLISYSLYLWHWPMIVFVRYYLVRDLSGTEDLLLLALMVGIAAASWQFVERPFRGNRMPIGRVRLTALCGSLLLLAVAAVILVAQGFPRRLSAAAAVINESVGTNYRCPISDYLAIGSSRACAVNLPSRDPRDADTVLLGNSHMQMYVPVWQRILVERDRRGLLVPVNGCLPTVTANISAECLATAKRNLAEVLQLPHAKLIVLGLQWNLGDNPLLDAFGRQLDNQHDSGLVTALDSLIAQIRQSGREVILIGPLAEPGWDVASVLSRQLAFGRPLDRPLALDARVFDARLAGVLDHFSHELGPAFVRVDSVQCAGGNCRYVSDGRALFADSNHLAAAEVERFREVFERALPEAGH